MIVLNREKIKLELHPWRDIDNLQILIIVLYLAYDWNAKRIHDEYTPADIGSKSRQRRKFSLFARNL